MRKYTILIIVTIVSIHLFGQTQKTFVKSFPNPSSSITVELNGPVEVKEWDQPFVRVLTTVSLDNGNSNVLTTLSRTGRYSLLTKNTESNTTIHTTTEHNPLKYKGQLIKEEIGYTIYVPQYSKVNVVGENKSPEKNEL